jgi:hypothetical protein
VNGHKPIPTAQHTSTTWAVVPAGKGHTTPARQPHTVPPPTQGHAAATTPTPTWQTTRPSTKSGFKPTPKPKCLPLRPLRVGSTGHGGQSLPLSGVIARRGRMGLCQVRRIPVRLSVVIPFLIFRACRSIIEVTLTIYVISLEFLCMYLFTCIYTGVPCISSGFYVIFSHFGLLSCSNSQ